MPLTEAHGLDGGKAVEGKTHLFDSLTGQWFDVVEVTSGKMPTPIDLSVGRMGASAAERCAFWGTKAQWRED